MTTNVPTVQFTPTGLVVPAESAVLTGTLQDWSEAFNGNLNGALNTPQGQAATSEAAAISAGNATFAQFVNQIDSNTASGFMQDAIGQIYFLNRMPGTGTVVTCTVVSAEGVPAGSMAQDTSGNIYVCTTGTAESGTQTAIFTNVVLGPIPCAPDTLTQIYKQVTGWDTITNAGAGVIGSNVESQVEFENRRAASVALNAHGSLPSIKANVLQVPGVIDCYATENVTGGTVLTGISMYPLAPHSLYVGVSGGDALAVVTAIWNKKDPGCNYNGSTTQNVQDTKGYSVPFPTYAVSFQTLIDTPISFQVNLINSATLPSDIDAIVSDAIIAQFTGQNGGQRAQAGGLILSGSYYGPIIAAGLQIGLNIAILDIFIGTAFTADATFVAGSAVVTVTTLLTGSITSGSTISSVALDPDCVIVRQLTGTTGGAGTYLMSQLAISTEGSAVAASGTLSAAMLMGIDMEPTISAENISVVLS